MTRRLLLRGGRVVDPLAGIDGRADVRVLGDVVTAVGGLEPEEGEQVTDVSGLIVAPGFIDVHVHLREPGQEWKETIASGTAAAAAGGFTTVFCMPNTTPALDSVAVLEELRRRIARDALVDVRPIAAISDGRRGRTAVDYDALAKAGAVGFSDDGESTVSSEVMIDALHASNRLGIPVMVHCEEPSLTGGAMHAGHVSKELGIKGIEAAAEEIIIDRDLRLAEMTGGWLHVCHVSTGRGLAAIAAARRRGASVTCEVMPHHLTMSDAWVGGCRELHHTDIVASDSAIANADTKVNPPLRPIAETTLLLEGIIHADVDVISTDHAPHARPEKLGLPFARAAFGINGSELALPTMLALVHAGAIDLKHLVTLLSANPARLWRLNRGTLQPGRQADIVVFDPAARWTVSPDTLVSRSDNTPLLGMELRGRVTMTLVGGDMRHHVC